MRGHNLLGNMQATGKATGLFPLWINLLGNMQATWQGNWAVSTLDQLWKKLL